MEDDDLRQVRMTSSYSNKCTLKTIIIILAVIILISIIITLYFKSSLFNILKRKVINSSKYDYLIVGSGLYGATFNYLAKKAGKTTLMLERRDTIGGNLYCDNIEGIFVHKYGPHIFHTDNKKVWDFVNSIVEFTPFQNQPISKSGIDIYNLPFNMWTYYQLWGINTPEEAQLKIEQQKYKGEVKNLEEQALSLVGKDIYNKLIKSYTKKQWGRECPNLPPFIIKRLPTRFTFDNNYFNDRYQGIPEGCYNAFIDKLLKDTKVLTKIDYNKHRNEYANIADKIVYTGKIDEYFDYKYGKLEYRTVRWDNEVMDVDNYQGNAVINYADQEVPYTRVIEHKHFEPYNKEIQEKKKTVVSYEYSEKWVKLKKDIIL